MRKEDFFEVLGELDDDLVKEVKTSGNIRRFSRLKFGAIAACIAVILSVGIPCFFGFYGLKDDQSLKPLKIIEYDGAYYEIVDMSNTEILDIYDLPHEITADMIGSIAGIGFDSNEEQTERIMYQYLPYADIVTNTTEPDQECVQRAVYVVEDGGYSFALFCNFIISDTNSHKEASEMFAVYGIDEAEDIASIMIGGETLSNFAEIQAIFDNLYHSVSIGNDDYQNMIFKGMSEEEQQALSIELADSMIRIKIKTTDGIVINNLNYYPTINYVYWALNYYRLNSHISCSSRRKISSC